jgi:hypothetical protein
MLNFAHVDLSKFVLTRHGNGTFFFHLLICSLRKPSYLSILRTAYMVFGNFKFII